MNSILWWIKRNNLKLSKNEVNLVLKGLELEGKIVNVSSGKVGKKRRLGTFLEGCTMDFTSAIHEESTEINMVEDEVEQPSQVSYQEVDTVTDQEAESRHQACGSSHSSDQEEEDVDMDEETESDQEATGTSNIGLVATAWVIPEKDLDYTRPVPGVEVANENVHSFLISLK